MNSFTSLSPRSFFEFLAAYIEYLRQKADGDEPDLEEVPQEVTGVLELFDKMSSSTISNLCILNAGSMFKLMELEDESEGDEDDADDFYEECGDCEDCPYADECPNVNDEEDDDSDDEESDEEDEDAECFRAAMTAFINELSKYKRIPKNIVFEIHEATDEEMRQEKEEE